MKKHVLAWIILIVFFVALIYWLGIENILLAFIVITIIVFSVGYLIFKRKQTI